MAGREQRVRILSSLWQLLGSRQSPGLSFFLHIRQTLDPVHPSHLFSLFDDLHRAFDETGLLEAMRAVGGTRLIALDATWYFSSQSKNIHCPNYSHLRHADGRITHFHNAITPVIVSPGCAQVVPLRGFHFLFTCKPVSHPYLTTWLQALEPGRDLHWLKPRVKGKSNRWE